jgi:serine/threonine protein kinase
LCSVCSITPQSLTPENFGRNAKTGAFCLLDWSQAEVIDVYQSEDLRLPHWATATGAAVPEPYVAPEVLQGKPYTVAADLYCLGRALEALIMPEGTEAPGLRRQQLALVKRLTAEWPHMRPCTLRRLVVWPTTELFEGVDWDALRWGTFLFPTGPLPGDEPDMQVGGGPGDIDVRFDMSVLEIDVWSLESLTCAALCCCLLVQTEAPIEEEAKQAVNEPLQVSDHIISLHDASPQRASVCTHPCGASGGGP